MTTTTSGLPAGLGQSPIDVAQADDDDATLWSVTTIINALDRPALLYWSAQMAAEAAIDSQATWRAMLADQGRDATVKWLRDARMRRPRNLLSSAELGTAVHSACETYALTGTRPDADAIGAVVLSIGSSHVDIGHEVDVITTMLDRFDAWLQRFSPSYQATEVVVFSPTYAYAGTSDGFLTIDGTRLIVDYKSSRDPFDSRGKPKTPYPEVALQLAAYRYAELAAVWRPRRTERYRRRYYLLSAAEQRRAVPVPEVDGALCIHITPEACEAFPIRADEDVHRSFLYVVEAARWKFELERHVVGPPLEAPIREAS